MCSYLIYADLDQMIKASMQKLECGRWQCLSCGFASLRGDHVKHHIEAKHINSGGVQCCYCDTVCPTRKALAMHIMRRHKDS